MQILKAMPADYDKVLQLLYLAMEDIAHTLTATDNKADALEQLKQFYLDTSSRLSYTNVRVCKVDDLLVGAMCAYGGAKSQQLDLPFINHLNRQGISLNKLDKECFNDEYYVDSLAVNAKYRKIGIAKSMLRHAEKMALNANYKKLALIVDKNKKATKAYYEKLGFVADTDLLVNQHKYSHMVKML